MRVTKNQEPAIRGQLANPARYTVLEARKDGTKFSTPALRRLSDDRVALDRSYASQQRHLVERVVDVAASFASVLLQASGLLAELDVLAAFGDLAACSPTAYCRPALTPKGGGDLVLRGSRHPCVEVQDGVEFVPNDCVLERGTSWFHVITGPNMGGKSTFIRQVGVCVLMAQVGCYVPASSATLSVRDAIFARVGAGDCQARAALARSHTPGSDPYPDPKH